MWFWCKKRDFDAKNVILKQKTRFWSKKRNFDAKNTICCPAERAITANRIAFGHDLGMFWAVPSLNFKHARTSLSFVEIMRKYYRFKAPRKCLTNHILSLDLDKIARGSWLVKDQRDHAVHAARAPTHRTLGPHARAHGRSKVQGTSTTTTTCRRKQHPNWHHAQGVQ